VGKGKGRWPLWKAAVDVIPVQFEGKRTLLSLIERGEGRKHKKELGRRRTYFLTSMGGDSLIIR